MEGINKEFITIESHFGVPENFIRANTRNKCSEDLVAMIQEIAKIMYPEDIFDIYLLPAEPGSYKDVIKLVKKHKKGLLAVAKGSTMTLAVSLAGYLTYQDYHEEHLHNKKMWNVTDTAVCLQLAKDVAEISKTHEIENFPEEKISEVCGSLTLKKRKNSFYNVLQGDSMIKSNETVLKDENKTSVFSKTVERRNFPKYVEAIPDEKYSRENLEGFIELISPVVKQQKEGKGISWKGAYYGQNIVFGSITLLKDGENIDFYMQDPDFKTQTYNRERTFARGDNMKVIFTVSGELKGEIFQNRRIYIKKVESYNEDIVEHKERVARNSKKVPDNQTNFIDDL